MNNHIAYKEVKMKKFILTLILSVFFILTLLVGSVNAETDGTQLIGKQGTCIELTQECASCSYVTLTKITFPNMSISQLDATMSLSGTASYNYSFCSTSNLGKYSYCMVGDVDGTATNVCKDFDVTSLGMNQSTSQGIGSAVYLFIMFGLTILFGFIGFKLTESKYLWVIGIFFLFLSLIFVVYDVWLGYEYHRALSGFSSSAIPETIFYIFMFLLVAGLLVSAGLLFTKWKDLARYYKKSIKEKEEEDIDLDFDE